MYRIIVVLEVAPSLRMFCEMLQSLSIVHQFRLSQRYRHHSLQEAQRKVADMQAKAKLAEEAKEAKVTLLCALSKACSAYRSLLCIAFRNTQGDKWSGFEVDNKQISYFSCSKKKRLGHTRRTGSWL